MATLKLIRPLSRGHQLDFSSNVLTNGVNVPMNFPFWRTEESYCWLVYLVEAAACLVSLRRQADTWKELSRPMAEQQKNVKVNTYKWRNWNMYFSAKISVCIWCWRLTTLGPAYNEFGYNEHPAITSNFFLWEKNTSDVKKVQLQRVPLITSKFLWIKLLVITGTQCT